MAFFDGVERRDSVRGGVAEAAQCVIVNGPVRRELSVNCGLGLLGPGWRANATIGRALALLVRECFAGTPAFGDPGQYSLCLGEDEEGSDWTPLHVQRGVAAEQSAVTVHSAIATRLFLDRRSTEPAPLLDSAAAFLRGAASPVRWFPGEPVSAVLLLGSESRRRITDGGWSKEDVLAYLHPALVAPAAAGYEPVAIGLEDLLVVAGGGPAYAACFWLVAHDAPPATRGIDELTR
jgi:hypothetical protein